MHGAVAGPGQLGEQGALADDGQVLAGVGVEQVVLDADDAAARAAQHAAAYDALGVGRGGLVEHRGRGGPPVDEQGVAVVVAQADAADVARRLARVLEVEPPEDQALVRGVEGGDPPGGLEDHRVALDEAALVPEPRPAVALAGQRLGGAGGVLELAVDAVDEALLVARSRAW